MRLLLVPILAAALHAGWIDQEMVSTLTHQDVEYRPAPGEGRALVGAYAGECENVFAAYAPSEPPPVQTVRQELWAGPVVAGDGYASLLYSARCGGKTLDLVRQGLDGRVVERVPLPVRGAPYPAKVVAGPDGSLAVAWVDNLRAQERQRVRVGVYGTDRWIRRPVTVFSRRSEVGTDEALVHELAIAVTPKRRVLVAPRSRPTGAHVCSGSPASARPRDCTRPRASGRFGRGGA